VGGKSLFQEKLHAVLLAVLTETDVYNGCQTDCMFLQYNSANSIMSVSFLVQHNIRYIMIQCERLVCAQKLMVASLVYCMELVNKNNERKRN